MKKLILFILVITSIGYAEQAVPQLEYQNYQNMLKAVKHLEQSKHPIVLIMPHPGAQPILVSKKAFLKYLKTETSKNKKNLERFNK